MQPPNANSREEITKGATDGITLPGLGHQLLSKELVDETLIISDMYELNEFMALDLLCTAQLQVPYHPGLPRGLTAILLYYDGKKALTSTLRMLVQARMGHSWKIDAPIALIRNVTEYTNKLQEDGLLDTILSLLENMDPVKVSLLKRFTIFYDRDPCFFKVEFNIRLFNRSKNC